MICLPSQVLVLQWSRSWPHVFPSYSSAQAQWKSPFRYWHWALFWHGFGSHRSNGFWWEWDKLRAIKWGWLMFVCVRLCMYWPHSWFLCIRIDIHTHNRWIENDTVRHFDMGRWHTRSAELHSVFLWSQAGKGTCNYGDHPKAET